MKLKSLFLALACSLFGTASFANNIQVANVSLTGWDAVNDYTMVKFDVSWENSWRTNTAPANWDAAWVFVKYRVNGGNWNHASLNNTGHSNPSGSTLAVGLLSPASAFNAVSNPGTGVFIHRSADGAGTVNFSNVQLRWNYGLNGVSDNDQVDVQVYAVEMVYVPQGSFQVGTGGVYSLGSLTNGSAVFPVEANGDSRLRTASGAAGQKTITLGAGSTTDLVPGMVLTRYALGSGLLGGLNGYDTVQSVLSATQFTVKNNIATTLNNAYLVVTGPTTPYTVASEGALTIDNTAGNLFGTISYSSLTIGNTPSAPAATLPAAYPKGYNAFYCMKYEISQAQWVDFLNSLTRAQQASRVATDISGTSVTNRFVMTNSVAVTNRNGIRCDATIPATGPVTFYNDLNANGIANQNGDGQDIAMNFINVNDWNAFLDWASLRPMTELEFEKATRGTATPTPNEYAWGTASATAATSLTNDGMNNELATPSGANAAVNSLLSGPLRVGNFARSGNTRAQSGASFYGIMDMTGNVAERMVSLNGTTTSRQYTGTHGNGALNASGNADAASWPSTLVFCIRGGSFNRSAIPHGMSADRSNSGIATNTREAGAGGRGVRTAQ